MKKEETKEKLEEVKLVDVSIELGDLKIVTSISKPLADISEVLGTLKAILEDKDTKDYLKDYSIKKKLNGYVG